MARNRKPVGVMIAAPEFMGFLVCLPLIAAVLTVQMGYLAGAAAAAGSVVTCLGYFFEQGRLVKDLQRMLSGAPSL